MSLEVASDAPVETSLLGSMIGSYRVKSRIGSGGVGSVYVAEHPVIGTEVAVKVLRPEIAADPAMVERFVMEARATSRITSPHIPRYLDFGYTRAGTPYAVMEYFHGETVGARFRRGGVFSLAQVADIVRQVASAMQLAHDQGIVHRDLKPDNLFLAIQPKGPPVVKVLDFGIAKVVAHNAGDTVVVKKTMIGLLLGTPQYCAPEQALGHDIGPAADVYALGATAYELLVGRPPFDGELAAVLGAKICSDPPPVRTFRADLPEHVERGLARMLARVASERMASMAEVLAEVDTWTAKPAAAEVATSPRSRWTLRLAIAGALVIGAGVGVIEPLLAADGATGGATAVIGLHPAWWVAIGLGALMLVLLAVVLLRRRRVALPAVPPGLHAWPEVANLGAGKRRIAPRDAMVRRLQLRPKTSRKTVDGPKCTPLRHRQLGVLRHRMASSPAK